MFAGLCGPTCQTGWRVQVWPWSVEIASYIVKSLPSLRMNGMYSVCQCDDVCDVSTTTGPAMYSAGSVGSGQTVGSASEVAPGSAVCENALHCDPAKSPGVLAPPSFALF